MKYRTDLLVDVSPLGERSGIGNYVRWSVKEFVRVRDVKISFVFRKEKCFKSLASFDIPPNVSIHFFPFSRVRFKREVLSRFDYSAFLSPDYYVLGGVNDAAVVHDLSPFDCPNTLSWKARVLYRWELRRTVKLAAKILVDSRFTENRLKEIFGCRGTVVYPPFSPDEGESPVKLPEKYLLFVGRDEPRKNLPFAVEVVRKLRGRGRNFKLVVVSPQKIRGYPQDLVVWAGGLSGPQLGYAYRRAAALLYPSTYEGFGYPVLEGAWYGTLVLASEHVPCREVLVEGFAFLPLEVEIFVDELERMLRNRETVLKTQREVLMEFVRRDYAKQVLGVLL